MSCEYINNINNEYTNNKNYKKNDPRFIYIYSKKKYWFKCPNCNNIFKMRIIDITLYNKWCNKCLK